MDWEKEIGIEGFLSKEHGWGTIKNRPEDFVVEEEGVHGRANVILLRGGRTRNIPTGTGNFLHVVLEKRDWDLHDVLVRIVKRLGISLRDVSFAGTKDKFALTGQWISLRDVKWSDLKKLDLKDVGLHTPVYANFKIRRGMLKGNWFRVVIRGKLPASISPVFPNFFGHQRFGSYRFVSHIVGKYLLLEDYEGAFMGYLTTSSPWEPPETREARKRLAEERDFQKALEYFPKGLRKERSLIKAYLRTGSFKRAILSLPQTLISLFLHAYQSYLFNKVLSLRLRVEIPEYGERGIVPGYASTFSPGIQGELEREVINEENIELGMFKKWRKFSTKGDVRPLLSRAEHLNIDGNTLSFFLEKGTYATSFLREILRPRSPVGFVFSKDKIGEIFG